ncbi:MAG: hypothetical protein ACXWDM_09535, partial [Nocardioides sp.]
RLTDTSGASAVLTPDGAGILRALPVDRRVGKRWAQAVIADPAAAEGVDLAQVKRLDVIGDSSDGRLWILDVAAAPASLAEVPERRLPLVSLGSLRVTEGDARGTSTARLPFTVTGEVTQPAQLLVGIVDQTRRGGRTRLRLDLAPGQTGGSIRYEYTGNTVDDFPRRTTSYAAFPVRGAMTDRYDGQVHLIDDDPAPRLRVRVPQRVQEGGTIGVRIDLSAATGFDSFLTVRAIRGTGAGRRLAVGDLPSAWLRRHFITPDQPARPLHRSEFFLFERLRAGERSGSVTIPVRADGVRESTERLTLRIQLDRQRVVRTVRVVD